MLPDGLPFALKERPYMNINGSVLPAPSWSRSKETAYLKRPIKRLLILGPVLIVGLLLLISALHVNSSRTRATGALTAPASAWASPPLFADGRLWYRVRGTGTMTITGGGCCESINFPTNRRQRL